PRLFRIANAVDHEPPVPHRCRRSQQKLPYLLRSLFISPVADPHHILLRGRTIYRTEDLRIRSLVERPHPRHSKPLAVDPSQHFPKHHHAVKTVDPVQPNLLGRGRRSMMRVMEEHSMPQFFPQRQQSMGQLRSIPLMHHHYIDATQPLPPYISLCERSGFICLDPELWIDLSELRKRRFTCRLLQQVFDRPLHARLKD